MCPVGDGWELPPGSEPWSDFHWFQPTPRADLVVVVLSEKPVWYTGHYVGGRMVPCVGRACGYCAAAIGAQVRYCFSVAEITSRRVGLMELGRSNGLLVQDWMSRHGGLRGMILNVQKHSAHRQSRTEMVFVDKPEPLWSVGIRAPDPALALYLTWHKAGFEMPAEFAEKMSFALRESKARLG